MKKTGFIIGVTVAAGLLSACGAGDSAAVSEDEPLQVLATTSQVGDMVNDIGGEYVEVETLMGPGVDPHLYQPTQEDIGKLAEADIIFYNGLNLEGNMQEVFDNVGNETSAVPVAENIPEDVLQTEADSNSTDPHVWFDPEMWSYTADAVTEELSSLNEENSDLYEEQGEAYKAMLTELDAYAQEELNTIPEESRVLVTAHDAFGYFGNAFNMEVEGLQGLSTDSEYSVRDVDNIVNLLVEREINAVFIESSVSDRSINAIIEGAAQQGHEVEIGGELYSDAMGEEGTEEGTYEGMFRHNVDTITGSLQ